MSAQGAILFVEYPKCSTCRKAKKWLDEHGVEYVDRHIVEDRPSADELASWHAMSGLEAKRFFNTSGKLYRELGIKAKLDAGMGESEIFELLGTNGMMVKRPIVVGKRPDGSDFVLLGFREEEWAAALL